jgi:HPt (histidine-containing phosphotransfer) domain-containing protein
MTAHVLDKVLEKCYASGIDDCIAKPFQLDTLQKKIISLTNISAYKEDHTINKAKYLDLFIKSFKSDFELLNKAINDGNSQDVKYLLHKMKGAALTMDFNELGDLIFKMEQKKFLDLTENLKSVKLLFNKNTKAKL